MKFQGDIRPLSYDPRYQGVVFSGSMKNAIKQAKAAPDYGLPDQHVPNGMTRNRAVLLQHLNLLPAPKPRIIYRPGDSESEGYDVYLGSMWVSSHLTLEWAQKAVERLERQL